MDFAEVCGRAGSGGRDLEYDSFAQAFGRRHASPAEYEHRRSVFRKNLETIQRVNEAGDDLTLTVNRFADWTKVRSRADQPRSMNYTPLS